MSIAAGENLFSLIDSASNW